jgi:predicted nucleic acid-binding Zn ribbon protein
MPWEPLPTGRGSEPRPLGDGLDRLARSIGVPSAAALSLIFGQWSQLVGDAVAANCRPIGLEKGHLTVAAYDPAWSTQLRLLEPEVIERIDELVGPRAVTKIVVRVQPR